jgi:hypothetical protein
MKYTKIFISEKCDVINIFRIWGTCSSSYEMHIPPKRRLTQRTTELSIQICLYRIWICQVCDYEEKVFLRCNALFFGESPTFRRNVLLTSGSNSRPTKNPAEAGCNLLQISCFSYSSVFKMKTIIYSETSGSPSYTAQHEYIASKGGVITE